MFSRFHFQFDDLISLALPRPDAHSSSIRSTRAHLQSTKDTYPLQSLTAALQPHHNSPPPSSPDPLFISVGYPQRNQTSTPSLNLFFCSENCPSAEEDGTMSVAEDCGFLVLILLLLN
ncbi:hypothetical protein M0R45_036831 [Rubus argutus]|uniref:Uncharacterized protein n=1 Tax=Rubus argutus TaxID=59490 RepID=A0AAW1W014_RUBAR